MVRSRPVLLLNPMSESVDLQSQRSESMLVTHVTTKDHANVPAAMLIFKGCPGLALPLTCSGILGEHAAPLPNSTVEQESQL